MSLHTAQYGAQCVVLSFRMNTTGRERAFPSTLGGLLELGCGLEGWERSGPLSQSTTLGLGGD